MLSYTFGSGCNSAIGPALGSFEVVLPISTSASPPIFIGLTSIVPQAIVLTAIRPLRARYNCFMRLTLLRLHNSDYI